MTDTASGRPMAGREKSSHIERHASIPEGNAQGKPRVDTSEASPQVRKSHVPDRKSRAPLPRDVTFSALSLERAERDPRGGIDQQNHPRDADPEPVGPLAEQFLEDLAARQAEALNRLRRQATTRTKDQP